MAAVVLLVYAWVIGAALGGAMLREAGAAYRALCGLIAIALITVSFGSVALHAASLAVSALAMGLALVLLRRRGSMAKLDRWSLSRPVGSLETAALGFVGAALAMGLIQALAPSTSWDAAVAHLALPSDFVREGRITLIPGNAYSAYPLLMHSLYTLAYAHGGELSVHLVAWAFAALACALVYDLGKQLAGRRAGYAAAAIMATAPIFGEQAGVASLDVVLAGVVAGALAQWLRWYDSGDRRALVLAGILSGSACGIRHTGFIVCVLIVAATVLRGGTVARGVRARIAPAVLVGLVAALAAAPWMLRSAIVAGNPFYPFFMSVFGELRVYDTEITALGAHESIKGSGLWYFLSFPWNVVMHPERFDGWGKSPGGLVLILGVPGVFIGGSKARWLGGFAVCGLVMFYHFQHLARYMLPFFVPMIAMAAIPCVAPGWRRVAAPVWAVGAAVGLVAIAAMVHFKVPVALGMEDRETYLTRRVERYPAFAYLNAYVPQDAGVLTLDPRTYYIDRPTFHNYDALKVLRDWPVDRQLTWFRDQNLRYLVYPVAYLEESPGFGEKGYLDQFDTWRRNAAHFQLTERLELPRPRSGGTEIVELYEIHPE